ncbi:MAG: SDR family NAD(P)-dependent oxidoreductase [Gammaproteobacteria bacterium]
MSKKIPEVTPFLQSKTVSKIDPIAVIGFSGRFPGGANSPEALWDTLRSGRDAVSDVDGQRWDLGWHNPDSQRDGRVYTRACGMLDQVDGFDADFFGISPRGARQIDPQQRLLLELAWEAFESAGTSPRAVAGRDVGVYVGISSNDYAQMSGAGWPDAYSNIGVSFSIAANRLSYVFDLHGPSQAIDTACSSSMVAIHQACQAISRGECESALAGGASVLCDIRPWLGFSRASMLSPDGRCKSFDESGNGYVRSEGGGLVLLKPLAAAERDNDDIRAVIRATGINSDGRTMGLAMPNGDAQASLLKDIYGSADIAPEDVFYVEAHGTGTSVGDPIECGALGRVLGEPRADGSACLIGSVKSNIGHLEPASGIAGMTKVLLALDKRELPANLHFNTPNPKIDFDGWKLRVVDEPVALPEQNDPSVMGVNSFGFGGTNAHAIVEEYRRPAEPQQALPPPPFFLLSASSEGALKELARAYVALLREPDADFATIAHGAAKCRATLRLRLVVDATTAADAADKLEGWLADEDRAGVAVGEADSDHVNCAFAFSGNGPQWWGMGRELMAENPLFREQIELIDACFVPLAGWSLIEEMTKPEEDCSMDDTQVAQPLLFALQMGLVRILEQADVRPDVVLGHSVGEVAAACVSGALSMEEATRVIYYRSRAQAATAGQGKMAALGIGAEAAAEYIEDCNGWVELAAVNGPSAVTVAGDELALRTLVGRVTEDGKFARLLNLNYPFHTKVMTQIRDELVSDLAGLAPVNGDIEFVSTVTGASKAGAELGAEYWYDNVREPVEFHAAVANTMKEQDVRLFVEIGPHPVIKDYIAQSARAEGAVVASLPTLRRPGKNGPESDTANIATAISAAHAHGAASVDELFVQPALRPRLPLYPWQRERHWRGAVGLPDSFFPTERDHPLLGARLPSQDATWENPIDKNLQTFLQDHVVQGSVLFPGAGYMELSTAAALEQHGHDKIIDLENFAILRPLVLSDEADPILQTVIDARDGTTQISSRNDRSSMDQQVHVRTRISAIDAHAAAQIDLGDLRARLPVDVGAEEHYRESTRRGLEYGPMFQGIQQVWLSAEDAEKRESLARVQLDYLNDESALAAYRSHPAIFDGCLQSLIPLVAQLDQRNVSVIPVSFERMRSYASLPPEVFCHCEILRESGRSVLCNLNIYNPEGRLLMAVTHARCQKANLTGAATSPLTVESWRPDTASVRHGALTPVPEAHVLAESVAAAIPLSINSVLERLIALYIADALDELRPPTDTFTLADFARHARIGRAQGRLLKHVLSVAETAGMVARDGDLWSFVAAERESAQTLWRETFTAHPACQAELLSLAEAGESLPQRLRGQECPPPSDALLAQLDDTSPSAAQVNVLMRSLISNMVSAWPQNRPLRILEIGGGHGGLTSQILALLPTQRTDYVFTDSDETLIARADKRFAGHQFLRCQTLDRDVEFAEQGIPDAYFDLVLVTDPAVLDDASSLSLEALSQVMSDQALLMVKALAPRYAEQLLSERRGGLDENQLEQAGFERIVRAGNERAAFVLAHAPARRPKDAAVTIDEASRFTIFAEAPDGLAARLTQTLEAAGHTVFCRDLARLVDDVETGEEPAGDAPLEREIAQLRSDKSEYVVVLAAPAGAEGSLLEAQSSRALATVRLVAALETARDDRECNLTLVTRGAFGTAFGDGPLNPSEAGLFGLGRVISNEHSALDVRCVDLHAAEGSSEVASWLADELRRRDIETEVQIVDGYRFVNRERINSLADEARDAGLKAESFALDFVPQGGIDSLHLRELKRRKPGSGEVEIEVKAAGLNFRDVMWCMGMLPEEAVEHGFSGATIGMECAGTVVGVGEGVEHLAPGDRVLAFASSCFGTHVTTAAKSVARMPDNMSFAEGATVPTTFLTAWYSLDYLARLQPGETVLIHGAAGGVGLAALQIAKLKGARTIGTAGSPIKRRMLELMGVDHVLNSRSLQFADDVMALTDGRGVDVVLNSLAGEAILKNLNCLRPFGRFLEIGKRDLYDNSRIGLRPFRNNISYFGIDADTLLIERAELAQNMFTSMMTQFESGALRPLPHQVVPISRASEAFRAMQRSRHVGKLVVSLQADAFSSLPVVRATTPITGGGTYLVTGGLGGFGLSTARWLVEQGADSLALVSRSGATRDEAIEAIAEFEGKGITVRAFAADVSDAQQLATMLETIRTGMPPLKGVIHSAAVIEDAPIMSIEREQLERVFGAKMVGAHNLHEATLKDELDLFVLYSSSSAVVGNPGQGAYVAANLYLDALAQHRRAQGRPALSVGWGAIADAGFLTRHENVRDMLKSRTGLDATPAREALEDLGRVVAAGSTRVSVARFDLKQLHKMLPAARVPRFLPIVPSDAMSLLENEETLADLLKSIPRAEQRAFISDRVVASTARILGMSANQINVQQPLAELGLDSLMAVELATSLERDVGQAIPVMQLLSAESLNAVVDSVAKILGVAAGDAPAAAGAAQPEAERVA